MTSGHQTEASSACQHFSLMIVVIKSKLSKHANEEKKIDDLHLGVSIWDKPMAKGIKMEDLLGGANKIVNRIAAENHLPLEDSKDEKLVLRRSSSNCNIRL